MMTTTTSVLHLIVFACIAILVANCEDQCKLFNLTKCSCPQDAFPNMILMVCKGISSNDELREVAKKLQNITVFHLQLDQLKLPFLPRGAFQGMILRMLYISNSPMTALAPNSSYGPSVFEGLDNSLTGLFMAQNAYITKFQWREFSHMKQLKILNLSDLQVDFSHGLSWIKRLPLSELAIVNTTTRVQFERKAFALMRNLKTVIFSRNRDLTLISRDLLPQPALQLAIFVISDCGIEDLPADMFDAMPVINYINLERNRLAVFNEATFLPVFSQLRMFSIAGNPIHCDENISWLVKELRSSKFESQGFVCSSPERLRNRTAESLHDSDLVQDNGL